MSKIWKKMIEIPAGVEVVVENNDVTVKWPKGVLSWTLPAGVLVAMEDGSIKVSIEDDSKKNLRWLSRTLIHNMIVGVTQWYEKKLLVIWVWYGAQVSWKEVVFSLGYAHKVNFALPEGIEVKTEQDPKGNTVITITGINKEVVGEVAAKMRELKKPEPYKGKWIRYFDEFVKIKPGKSAKK